MPHATTEGILAGVGVDDVVQVDGPMTGRVVVVTGAAGAIGHAVMARFSADGDRCVGLDLRSGENIVECDISDETQVREAFLSIEADHGAPTVLINNGGMTGSGGVEQESPEQWRRILDVNLTSAYLCCREAVPWMRTAGGGKIVNMASVNGRFGGSALSGPAYAVSKGGLITLSRFLAREHAEDNIQVNAVAPGPHDTPMWDALDEERKVGILAMVPSTHAPGDPRRLAGLVQFLCTEDADYITGATIDVNGGQWMG